MWCILEYINWCIVNTDGEVMYFDTKELAEEYGEKELQPTYWQAIEIIE